MFVSARWRSGFCLTLKVKIMELLTVPGVPNYRVDVENGVVYKMAYGRLKEVKMRTKYKSFTLQVRGRTVGTTLYRMMYCAINQIELTKIPPDICISMEDGKLVVQDRRMVRMKTEVAKKRTKEKMERVKLDMDLIERYYRGDVEPMLVYLGKVEKSLTYHFIEVKGICRDRAEIIVGNAVNKYLDKLRDGVDSFRIRSSIMGLAYHENKKISSAIKMNKQNIFDKLFKSKDYDLCAM